MQTGLLLVIKGTGPPVLMIPSRKLAGIVFASGSEYTQLPELPSQAKGLSAKTLNERVIKVLSLPKETGFKLNQDASMAPLAAFRMNVPPDKALFFVYPI